MTDRTYPYYLVRTANHGGGVVSRHWTLEGAQKARSKYRDGAQFYRGGEPCECGCVVVVAAENYQHLYPASDCPSKLSAARKG